MRKTITTVLALGLTAGLLAGCAAKTVNSASKEDEKKDEFDEALYQTVCSADDALKLSKGSDVVVIEDMGCTSGQEVWDAFYKDTSAGKPSSVLCANYYVLDPEHMSEELYEEEKDEYPQLFFTLIEFDGKEYSVKSRLSSSTEPESQETDTYKCLLHYTGKAPSESSLYKNYEYYVLTDDPDVTWEQIEQGMFSSQYEAWIKHKTVYHKYTN